MTVFEEIRYTLTGRKPVNYAYDPSGKLVVIKEDTDRWILRSFVRLLMFLLLLVLLRFLGFIPANWSEFSQVIQISRVSQSDNQTVSSGGTVDQTGSTGNTNGTGSGGTGSDGQGTLVFGSGDNSTNGLSGNSATQGINGLQGPKGDKGDVGPMGPAGPQGPAGQNGTNGSGGVGSSSGQGAGSIGTCDDSVDLSLRSYWTGSEFKLDRITISNVSSACNGLDLVVYLQDGTNPNPVQLLNLTVNNAQVISGTITLERTSYPSIGNVISNQIRTVAFEIAG